MKYIDDMMSKMKNKHNVHMMLYGEGNQKRLTGIHETSSFKKFSYGTGNRAASFRIPTVTRAQKGKGYVEDRRPASNIDPYVVAAIIVDTALLEKSKSEILVNHYENWTKFLSETTIERP